MLLWSVFLFYFVSQYIDIQTCWTWIHTPLVPTSLKFSERKEHIKCSSFCYCWCFHCHELNPAKCYMILPLSRPEVLHFSGNIWHVPSASVIAVSPVPGSPVELWNIFTIWSWNIFTNHNILIWLSSLYIGISKRVSVFFNSSSQFPVVTSIISSDSNVVWKSICIFLMNCTCVGSRTYIVLPKSSAVLVI